jgi:outer membrane protein assembly factor BamB
MTHIASSTTTGGTAMTVSRINNRANGHKETKLLRRILIFSILLLILSSRCEAGEEDRLLWKLNTYNRHFWNGNCTAEQPVVFQDMVLLAGGYFWSDLTNLFAVDKKTGSLKWKAQTKGLFAPPIAVSNGQAYVAASKEALYAFDLSNGEPKWVIPGAVSGPSIVDNVVYVNVKGTGIIAANANTGSEIWRLDVGKLPKGQPIVDGNQLYFATWDGFLYAINRHDRTVFLKYKLADNLSSITKQGTMVFVGGFDMYPGQKSQFFLYALDVEGKELKWRFPVNSIIPSAPSVIGNLVIIGTGYGDQHVYAIDKKTGKQVWKTKLGYGGGSSLYYGNRLYVTAGNDLVSLNPETGSVLWRFETDEHVHPAVADDGVIYFGSDDCNFYAIGAR